IAFYAGRPTLRYGDLPPQGLRSVIDWLHANGYRPYVVLEEWEEREYRKHFAPGRDSVSRLEIPVLAETTPDIPVRLYDPFGSVNTTVRRAVIPIAEAPKCGRPAATWIR